MKKQLGGDRIADLLFVKNEALPTLEDASIFGPPSPPPEAASAAASRSREVVTAIVASTIFGFLYNINCASLFFWQHCSHGITCSQYLWPSC
jgi:hypothetical protein